MLACAYPALDRPMILFQDVVEILHRSMSLASAHGRSGKRRVETCSAVERRTRWSASTIGGAAPDAIIGRAAADRVGARPYRATRFGRPPDDITIICETVR